jgi:pantoate--beta-alanine ligase
MKVFESAGQIHAEINFLRSQGKKIGLVPTMGALHKGHIALIERALMACDNVTCSIFVNPLQFNNPDDYKKYPNTIAKDTRMLEEIDCHLLFHPDYEQVYGQSKPKEYDLGHLNHVMEGKFRPGHFQGVANVVLRFFEILQPDMAFFGLKDYQQYMVIKRVTEQLMPAIQIVGVETIRDEKGLAMSSRNLRLTPEEYNAAIKVPELLKEAGGMLGKNSIEEIKAWFTMKVDTVDHLKNEYIEFADGDNLEIVIDPSSHKNIRVFTAFYAGEVRLIDNMPV